MRVLFSTSEMFDKLFVAVLGSVSPFFFLSFFRTFFSLAYYSTETVFFSAAIHIQFVFKCMTIFARFIGGTFSLTQCLLTLFIHVLEKLNL